MLGYLFTILTLIVIERFRQNKPPGIVVFFPLHLHILFLDLDQYTWLVHSSD